MRTEKPEFVFVAAARVGGILANNNHPAQFLYENLEVQNNLIHGAYEAGVKKLLFLGSSCIYPKHAPQPLKEEYLLSGPLEPTNEWYAIAKIAGVKMCQAYRGNTAAISSAPCPRTCMGRTTTTICSTRTCCPRSFANSTKRKWHGAATVTCWGSGNRPANFSIADDLGRACVFLMQNYSEEQFINVGYGSDVTIRELAETIKRIVGFSGEIVWDTSKPDGTPRKVDGLIAPAGPGLEAAGRLRKRNLACVRRFPKTLRQRFVGDISQQNRKRFTGRLLIVNARGNVQHNDGVSGGALNQWRWFLVVLLFGVVSQPVLGANRFAAPGHDRPNFLLLLSDDQTFRALGSLGELEVRTPHLDRLAKRGTLFTHCFNQGGWSGAVCIPSRMMLITGRTLWQCRGTNGQGIAPGVALWGETLRGAGYQTFMAGKWHLPDPALRRSFDSVGPLTGGFLESTKAGGPAYSRPAANNPWTPDDARWNGHWLTNEGRLTHSSELIADAAIGYLQTNAAQSSKPFFLYIGFNAPHDPRQAPKEDLDLYPPAKLRLPPNFLTKHPFPIEATFSGRDELLAPYPRTPEIIRVHLQEYYAIITHMDAQIGRILDALETSGQSANTIIAFTSDQGLAVGQHGLMGKQNLYDHSLRMPFILAGPGIPKGKRLDALVNMQSLYATSCELAGVAKPETVQFPSLVPLITGKKKRLNDALYSAFLDRQRAVRTADWKLIRTPLAGQVQLFNLKSDPWEMRNLASERKHASTLAMMDDQLRRLMREMKDPLAEDRLFNDSSTGR